MSRDREVRSRGFLVLMFILFALCILTVLHLIPWQAVLVVTVIAIGLTHRKVLAKVDYGLLLTFVCLFVFTGNIAHVDAVADALGGMMSWDSMLASLGISQVISNVPAATLLSGFTSDWQGLLVGVDIGGFGTPIASMASMISLGIYHRRQRRDDPDTGADPLSAVIGHLRKLKSTLENTFGKLLMKCMASCPFVSYFKQGRGPFLTKSFVEAPRIILRGLQGMVLTASCR